MSPEGVVVWPVRPCPDHSAEHSVLVCEVCEQQLREPASMQASHWYCLKESMWSEHLAVQVLAYRTLKRLGEHGWAQDLLGQIYLDDETQRWADDEPSTEAEPSERVVDSNGTVLEAGDTVTLIKDLVVKGANFTAKRGTTVKNIVLTGDPKYVEGKVNGTTIVLVAAFLKKA